MHIHLCPSVFLKGGMLVWKKETLVSSWIDLNFSIGLDVHVARAVYLQDLLEK